MYRHKGESILSGGRDGYIRTYVSTHFASFSFIFRRLLRQCNFKNRGFHGRRYLAHQFSPKAIIDEYSLTHPNWLVKYCRQESCPYVQAPGGFYLSRLTMAIHRNTKINVYAIARTAQKLRGSAMIKRDGIYYRESKGMEKTRFQNRGTSMTHLHIQDQISEIQCNLLTF